MENFYHLEPLFITNAEGRKQSVILSIQDFEALMEDIEDLAAVAERRADATISHEELLAGLKENGLL
ncbi:MAG: hypothetical protein SWH68_07995 [Thermodesulfobacteriota bacterium]|nr:hypothetical protein [Thermodesulfobacteriota bacterium]